MPKLKAKILIHHRFGTATLSFGKLKVDVASARKETYSHPGQLPEVSFSSLADDLKRRDFTINAMAVNISGKGKRQLIDPFAGKNDLASGRIRVLHDLSFQDDPTRIFRAVRFEQRYGFRIEPHTLKLLKSALDSGFPGLISPQRKRHEFILIFKEAEPFRIARRLKGLGIMGSFCPELRRAPIDRSLFLSLARQVYWFNRQYPCRRKLDTWLIYLMALADKLTSAQAAKISGRLSLHKGEEKRILSVKSFGKNKLQSLSSSRISPSRIFALLEPLSYEAIIFIRAKYASLTLREHIADFLEIYNGMRVGVSGEVLRKLGLSPGPAYQAIFSRVLNAKLNGLVKGRREELALIRRLAKGNAA
jgi:tRNA nucleotidyltransferase (CCA-adding enzyme)